MVKLGAAVWMAEGKNEGKFQNNASPKMVTVSIFGR
jgi:hypothetical protein